MRGMAAVAKYLLSDLFNRFHLLSYFYVMQQHENGVQNNNAIDESACNGIHHFLVTLSVFRKTGEHRCLQTENASFLTNLFRQFHDLKSIFLLALCQQLFVDGVVDTHAKQSNDANDHTEDKHSSRTTADDLH